MTVTIEKTSVRKAFAILLGIFLLLEVLFSHGEEYPTASSVESIRQEMPGALLTEQDRALARRLLDVAASMEPHKSLDWSGGNAAEFGALYFPDGMDIYVTHIRFSTREQENENEISYYEAGGKRITLQFTGTYLHKYVTVYPGLRVFRGLWESLWVGLIGHYDRYTVERDTSASIQVAKFKSRHRWFGWFRDIREKMK